MALWSPVLHGTWNVDALVFMHCESNKNNIAPPCGHCNLLSIGKCPCGCEERSGHVQQEVSTIVARNGLTIHHHKNMEKGGMSRCWY
jgi:hypothetical protein